MEMVKEYIKFEKKNKFAIIEMNNPPVNSLNMPLMDQLSEKLIQIERDEGIWVVILTGSGKFFAAGGDIKELEKISTQSEGIQLSNRVNSVFKKIETFSKPIIAAINGPCLGGGLELAMACHIRISDEEAKFGLPEIKLGLMPGGGGTQRLPRIVGRAKAYQMILTGDTVDSKEAFRINLVNCLAPKGECMAYAERYAAKISQNDMLAIAAALKAIQASERDEWEGGLRKEAELFGHLCESPGKKERIRVFLEGRK